MMCRCVRGRNDIEKHFPHWNWPVLFILLPALSYTGFIMFTPSIYQFIITPRTPPEDSEENENTEREWPGLGGTERDYAWVTVSFAICETAFIPVSTIMLDTLPFTPTLLMMMLMYAVSGALYASSTEVWMVILARGIMGATTLLLSCIVHTYIGEVSTILDEIRGKKGKGPMKSTIYRLLLFSINAMQVLLLGINAGLVRIPSVNPYQLPGWFLTALAVLSIILVLLFFSEPRPWTCRVKCNKCSCRTGKGLSMKLKSKAKTRVLIIVFVFACGYVNGQTYSVIYTLVTPLLSDQFGFSVDNTALYFVGLAIGSFATCIVQLIVKWMKGNGRIVVFVALSMSLVGCVLVSDWPAIGGDTCFNPTINGSHEQYFMISNVTDNMTLLEEMCKAQSSSSHQCFWNPQSRITGDYCNTCIENCLSHQTSLDFYQFSVGMFLIIVGSDLEYVFNLFLSSEIFSAEEQGRLMPLIIGCGALGRAISSFWFVESYAKTGRHTYLPMSITIGCLLVLLLSLVALYKDLAPRVTPVEVKEASNAIAQDLNLSEIQPNAVTTTSPLPVLQQDITEQPN